MAQVQEKEAAVPEQTALHPTATLVAPGQDAEAVLRATLDALSAHIAVLDETGTIIAVNQAWRDFAASAGFTDSNHGVGTNYLDICEHAADENGEAARTMEALRDIAAGRRSFFRMDYPCMSPDGPRWFELRVSSPGGTPVRRVVVAHEDITHIKQTEEALARLNARLMRLQDEERRTIARELHDTTAQNLLAISLNAARLHERRWQRPEQVTEAMAEILDLTEQSLQEVRTLCYLVHPPLLDDVGLEAALRWLARGFAERSGIEVDVRVEELGVTLSQDAATAIFRVAQEALLNVTRHSGSAWARLSLRRAGPRIELDIEDKGCGTAVAEAADKTDAVEAVGVGISGMRIRLEQLGGGLRLRQRQPGLLVRAMLPIEGNAASAAPE